MILRTVPVVAVAALAVTACGDDDAPAGDGRPVVVATTSIWGDVVANVACDGIADVRVIVPPGADPHTFEPSLQDRELFDDAALVVANGADLEESLVDVIATVRDDGVGVFEMTSAMSVLETGDRDHAEDEEHADDDHGSIDPHVWQDPTRVAAALPALRDALVDAGLDAGAVDRCVADYRRELDELDAEVASMVAAIPEDRRVLVTNHDSLAYLADRYGFDVVGTVIPAPTTLAETNPADLEELASVIADTGVPAIFAEEQHSSREADALAERVGDVRVVELFTDSLGPEGSGADTYSGLVRTNAAAIADALGA
jgi:zinc/manganese transport system substrate-binding protein